VRRLAVLLAAAALTVSTATVSAQTPLTLSFGPGRDANQGGTVMFTPMGQQTKVTINMPSGGAGVQQPAHLHVGTCPGVGAVEFPLTNVVDGKSETTVNASMAQIMARQHAINVHKSAAESGLYTACVDLPLAAAAPVPVAAPVQVPSQLPKTGGAPLGLLVSFGLTFLGLGFAARRR